MSDVNGENSSEGSREATEVLSEAEGVANEAAFEYEKKAVTQLREAIDEAVVSCEKEKILDVLTRSIYHQRPDFVGTILTSCSLSLPFGSATYIELFMGLWKRRDPIYDDMIEMFLDDGRCNEHRLLSTLTLALKNEYELRKVREALRDHDGLKKGGEEEEEEEEYEEEEEEEEEDEGFNENNQTSMEEDGEGEANDDSVEMQEHIRLYPSRLELLKQHCTWNRRAIQDLHCYAHHENGAEGCAYLHEWLVLGLTCDPVWPFEKVSLHAKMDARVRMATIIAHYGVDDVIYSLFTAPNRGIRTSHHWKHVTESTAAMIEHPAASSLKTLLVRGETDKLASAMEKAVNRGENLSFGCYSIGGQRLRIVSGKGIGVAIIALTAISDDDAFETHMVYDSLWTGASGAATLHKWEGQVPTSSNVHWIVLMGQTEYWRNHLSQSEFKEVLRYADFGTFNDIIRNWMHHQRKHSPDFIISWI